MQRIDTELADPAVLEHSDTTVEMTQSQSLKIKFPSHRRVRRARDLKSAVEPEAVGHVGSHTTTGCRVGLQHRDLDARRGQVPGRDESG